MCLRTHSPDLGVCCLMWEIKETAEHLAVVPLDVLIFIYFTITYLLHEEFLIICGKHIFKRSGFSVGRINPFTFLIIISTYLIWSYLCLCMYIHNEFCQHLYEFFKVFFFKDDVKNCTNMLDPLWLMADRRKRPVEANYSHSTSKMRFYGSCSLIILISFYFSEGS